LNWSIFSFAKQFCQLSVQDFKLVNDLGRTFKLGRR